MEIAEELNRRQRKWADLLLRGDVWFGVESGVV